MLHDKKQNGLLSWNNATFPFYFLVIWLRRRLRENASNGKTFILVQFIFKRWLDFQSVTERLSLATQFICQRKYRKFKYAAYLLKQRQWFDPKLNVIPYFNFLCKELILFILMILFGKRGVVTYCNRRRDQNIIQICFID